MMRYVLITPKGKAVMFFVEAAALIFQQAYGGTITKLED